MATSQPSPSSAHSNFDILGEITCLMCQKTYKDPVVLPCLHYYCKTCLEEKLKDTTVIVCPKCGQECEMSLDSIQKQPRELLADKSIALRSIMARRILTDCEVMCELCNTSSVAKAYCQYCYKYLCSFCEEAHRRIKTYAGHVVLKLTEIVSTGRELGSASKMAPPKMICMDHEKELKIYCFDCDKLICRDCEPREHSNHVCKLTNKAVECVRERLLSEKDQLEQRCSQLMKQQVKLQDKVSQLQRDGAETSHFVNQAFDIVLQQFQKYRSNLVQSISNKTERETRELEKVNRRHELAKHKAEPLLSLMEHNLEHASPEEILCLQGNLRKQVTVSLEECRECLEAQIPQAESFNTHRTSCARIIGAIGSSLSCADPIMCSLEGEGAHTAELGTESKFTILVNQSNEGPCTGIQNVGVELSAIETCQVCETSVRYLQKNMYEVKYTPKVQGQHILKVMVNERPIFGNPFHVLIKRPLLEANQPILIIRGVKKLHDLALHRNGRLIATQHETGCVVSIDRRGKEMKVLLRNVGRPHGVATDRQGSVFLSQNKKCCIQKYAGKTLELVAKTGSREASLGNFHKPGRMALSGKGELYICDYKNSRIQVFDDDLEYIRWYGITKPTGVAVDDRGDLYVTENGKNSLCKVYVESKRGIATMREGLADPQGVYVDKDHVYVVEGDAGRVTVLDRDGEFVTTLGAGMLRRPGGIAGDQDGYLYVCDQEEEAIFVF